MTDARLEHLDVGAEGERRRIAVLTRDGASPGLLWLGGYRSDMTGTKAAALDGWAAEAGHAATRFDYSGHGRSGGRFEDGTISRWLDEADAVFAAFAPGRRVLVGSSMGGWLALLLARRLRQRGEAERLAGIVLVAPAVDMTRALMADLFDDAARQALQETGVYHQPSGHGDGHHPITAALIADGENHLFGSQPFETGCPVHVIQGMRDEDVPWPHATALMERLAFDDAVLTLVRDGDHRLSRPEDIARLIGAVEAMIAG